MTGRVGRIAAVTAMLATGTGAAMFGAGTASAATNPLIVGGCEKVVQAKPGQSVKVDASGLLGQAVAPIYLGDAPSKGVRTLSIPTSKLVKTVNGVPLLGGLLSRVTGVIGQTCDVTVNVVNAVHKPVADGAGGTTRNVGKSLSPVTKPTTEGVGSSTNGTTSGLLADPANPPTGNPGNPPGQRPPDGNPGNPPNQTPQPPFNGGGPGDKFQFFPPPLFPISGYGPYGNLFSPNARYGNLPFITSGVFTPGQGGFGQQVPGFTPQFGNLGQDGENDAVQNAGQAEAFGSDTGGNDVGLPLLVAVLALSGASASLVRTWVLRRAAS